MASNAPAPLGNLVRLTPLLLNELPAHPSIPDTPAKDGGNSDAETRRPGLLTFLRAILDEGGIFLDKSTLQSAFASQSSKSSPPSTSSVQILKRDVPLAEIETISWDGPPIPRRKPRTVGAEYWFARRSRHPNVSSKEKPGSASWDEFVFGLRDQHSKHECDFTPTLYDARHVLDWNSQVGVLESEGKLAPYSHVTMSIYEMCHTIPPPLQPRCFPVLVCTAATSATSFLAITVPVDLQSIPAAFYSSGRNTAEGSGSQQRKKPVTGMYAAVETAYIDADGQIDWTMATASDAKGSLPMFAQKMGIPGAIAKDVGYFLKWIPTVDGSQVVRQEASTS